MVEQPRILILILSTTDRRYCDFIRACSSTWLQRAKELSMRYVFYQGGAVKDHIVNNTLSLVADDSLLGTGRKLLRAFAFVEREGFEYDYIFRVNLSSYIYVEKLSAFVTQHQDERLYAGVVGHYSTLGRFANKFDLLNRMCLITATKHQLKYASGSGFLISRSNVREVLSDESINIDLVDDVMISECLSRHGIPIIPVPRIDLSDDRVSYSKDILKFPDLIKTCYHIRLKSKNRSVDVKRMFLLDEYNDYPASLLTEQGILRNQDGLEVLT